VAGAWVLADISEFDHFVESRIMAPPIVLIVAGSIVFAIAFLGCYGAIKEHYNILIAVSKKKKKKIKKLRVKNFSIKELRAPRWVKKSIFQFLHFLII